MYRANKKSYTNVNREGLTIKYTLEYTEKDESIKDDYSNMKQFEAKDLEEMMKYMFQLRQLDKHNVSIGYNISDSNGWLVEDYVNNMKIPTSSTLEEKQQKSISILEKTIEVQAKELELYKIFLEKYNSSDMFEKFKKAEESKHTYYYRLRPPAPGCQSKNGMLEMNGDKIIHNDRTYWGSCTYDRELSDNELYDYDLDK